MSRVLFGGLAFALCILLALVFPDFCISCYGSSDVSLEFRPGAHFRPKYFQYR